MKKNFHFFEWKHLMMVPLLILLSVTVNASSHREAPLIANDPLADNTDVYAFRSPDDSSTVTLIANFIPFQLPVVAVWFLTCIS